ncbi:MAG: hypothetical protein H6738_05825 [Alphaproteobacteria bacterium]|nr:hypothetical protein [Alphaproteobacteria bacterium]MCB9696284.1 hypothetical protein [Alphaproteobacteria bacterium]
MRATLRSTAADAVLWFETGDRFELPEITQPTPTGPTDEGGPGRAARAELDLPRRDPTEEAEAYDDELITEEVSRGRLLRLLPRNRAQASLDVDTADRLPALAETPEPVVAPNRIDDEMSTGLFEPFQWDEADPYTTGDFPHLPPLAETPPIVERTASPEGPAPTPPEPVRVMWSAPPEPEPAPEPEPRRPHLSVVRSAEVELDEDYGGQRALPLPAPPRPPSVAGWDLPMPAPRAVATLPPWFDEERMATLVVIDPTLARRPRRSPLAIALAEASAWVLGFLLTFLGGSVASSSLIVVALVARL